MGIKMLKELIGIVKNRFENLVDKRKGKNISYKLSDICMAGYSVFHMQSASFLSHQERLAQKHAKHNGESLFTFSKIPSDNHIRNTLDTIETKELAGIFNDLHGKINKEEFKVEGGLVAALDGVYFFSSEKISCKCCLTREQEGKTRNYHAMLVPALIHPEQKCALPMMPEFIDQNDGQDKQDCEINSAKRWLNKNVEWLIENKVTLLGDDLFSRAPLIKNIMALASVRYIFVAKSTSHTYLSEWIGSYSEGDYQAYNVTEKQGNKSLTYHYKIYTKVPLNGDHNSPEVNYFEIKVINKTGKEVYNNSFVTNHDINFKNIHTIARMGRNRWKIENEAFNILKTKGYNLEHNFGHGKANLSNVLACLNLLAFLVHHLSEQLCEKYKRLRECFGARSRFFQTLATILSVQLFNSWDVFLDFMLSIYSPHPRMKPK